MVLKNIYEWAPKKIFQCGGMTYCWEPSATECQGTECPSAIECQVGHGESLVKMKFCTLNFASDVLGSKIQF